MRLALEKLGPGIAFWRAKKHGWDKWAWGLFCFTVDDNPDWWHWNVSLSLLDFNFAKGGHFDELTISKLSVGPLSVKLFYIEDRKN